jgi:hypothetical protein
LRSRCGAPADALLAQPEILATYLWVKAGFGY